MTTRKTVTFNSNNISIVGGLKEGISRCISQSVVYGIERHKTQMQIYGSIKNISLRNFYIGCATSGCTAGLVFTTYFTVYNNILAHENPVVSAMAGTVAGLTTSFMKIPIGNSMRILHTGKANNIFNSAKLIYKTSGMHGLYKGYKLSLIEDIIEMDVRMRLYNYLTENVATCAHANTNAQAQFEKNLPLQTLLGGISGAFASGLTTPFDTLRAKMVYNQLDTVPKLQVPVRVPVPINVPSKLMGGLYNGVQYRSLSNALKSGTFFLVYEILKCR